MNQVPMEWKSYIKEVEYLFLLINPQFIKIEGLIILQAHYDPETFKANWLPIIREHPNESKRIENTLNHIHLGDFTDDPIIQNKIGKYIRKIWRERLKSKFPRTKFEMPLKRISDEWELELWTMSK